MSMSLRDAVYLSKARLLYAAKELGVNIKVLKRVLHRKVTASASWVLTNNLRESGMFIKVGEKVYRHDLPNGRSVAIPNSILLKVKAFKKKNEA